MNEKTQVQIINEKVNLELADKETVATLLATTFKELKPVVMKQALLEGMMRGFKFDNFLKKDVYAIPFKESYSLVTSIDFSRKIGQKSGIVGKSAPVYEMDADKIISCEVTVKRKVGDYIGDYTAKVYFNEYYKPGKNGYPSLWDSKPKTMIAKVAEMHALRMACPEELAKSYIEEEITDEVYDYNIKTRIKEVEEDKKQISKTYDNEEDTDQEEGTEDSENS